MAVSPQRPVDVDARRPREVAGTARLGKRKHLVKRIGPGDVAILDHRDLDRVSAEDLVATGVQGVVNCSVSSTGRYPNMGPLLLVQAGVHLIDAPGAPLFDELRKATRSSCAAATCCATAVLARGELQEPARVAAATDERRREIGEALERFAHNTIEHMLEERELLAASSSCRASRPSSGIARRWSWSGASTTKRTSQRSEALRRATTPVIVAVDGGADAIIDEGFCPT